MTVLCINPQFHQQDDCEPSVTLEELNNLDDNRKKRASQGLEYNPVKVHFICIQMYTVCDVSIV